MCVCVFVHHINRLGPNLIIIHLEKQNAVADPVSVVCRTGGEKGIYILNGAAPVYKPQKTNAKTIPPESKIENIQFSRKNKTKQKSRRDDNRHERTRTLKRGSGRNVVLAKKRDAQWRSNYSRYRRKGQTGSKTSFDTATSGDTWY